MWHTRLFIRPTKLEVLLFYAVTDMYAIERHCWRLRGIHGPPQAREPSLEVQTRLEELVWSDGGEDRRSLAGSARREPSWRHALVPGTHALSP